MDIYTPTTGRQREDLLAFLAENDLHYDPGITHTVLLRREGKLIATGSLQGKILKCVAVSPAHRGEGLLATIVTELHKLMIEQGIFHYFLFTKPENLEMFQDMGFYPLNQTPEVLLMENQKEGLAQYLQSLQKHRPPESGKIGGVVMNCNPFTYGHRHLLEVASQACDFLHIFLLSEDQSYFSQKTRLAMVEEGVKDLLHCHLHPTSHYLISQATFPSYFWKDQAQAQDANCLLDLQIFGQQIAPALGITQRFVGSEPFCQLTQAYNRKMQEVLPQYGISVTEIPRKTQGGQEISASRVRAILQELDRLLPERQGGPLPDPSEGEGSPSPAQELLLELQGLLPESSWSLL